MKSFGLDIVIGATIGSAISAIKTVSNSANMLGSTIKKLENRKIDIIANDSNINRYKKAIQSAENEIDKLRKKQQFLREKISMTTDKSKIKELRNELNKVSTTIKKISNQKLNLKEKLQNAENEVKKTNKEFIKLGKTIDSINKHKINIQTNIDKRNNFKSKLFDTMALGTTIALPFKAGIEFESSMARVKALSGATGEQFKQLESTAKKLGATTTFSASQAAEGMQFLAMAGFKTNDITKAMPGLLDLAAAGQTDLAETADITSNILSGFGIKADKTGHVADVMAKAMTTANVDTRMLGETMKYVAPAAAGLGASLEEVTTLTAKLGDVGIQGSSAGTALRSMYVRMAAPPKEAQKAIKALGITTKDSAGNFVGMINIIKQLQQKTKGLSDTQVNGLMKHLFGVEAMSGAIALMKVPAKELDKYEKSLKNADGTAKKIAKTQNDTVAGSFKALGSALEGVSIAFSSLFLPVIKSSTQVITKITSGLNSFIENHKILASIIGGVVGGVVAFTVVTTVLGYAWTFVSSAFSKASLALTWLRTNLTLTSIQTKLATFWTNALGVAQKIGAVAAGIFRIGMIGVNAVLMANPIGLVVGAIGLLIGGLVWAYNKFDWFRNGVQTVWNFVKQVFSWSPIGIIVSNWSTITGWFSGFWNWIKDKFNIGITFISNIFAAPVQTISTIWSRLVGWFNSFWGSLGAGFSKGVNFISNVFVSPINAIKKLWGKLIGWIKSKIEWISNTAKKIKNFFSFGSDNKEKTDTKETKSSVTKKVIASTAIAAHVTTAAPIIKPITANAIKPISIPKSQVKTTSIEQIQNKTQVQKNENVQTSQAQTIMYQFHFGDIKIEAKDGKIDEHSLKAQIEDVLKEIDFEHKQRSLSDVM